MVYNSKPSPTEQPTPTNRDAEEPIKDDLFVPLTARTLANRNRRIFTLEDRVEHLKYSYSKDHQPQFTRLGCLTRVLYRILSLDSRLTIKIRFLFSFVGSLFVTFGTTLAFMFKDLEFKSVEKKGLEPGNEDGWKAFYFTFAMVIVGLVTLTCLEIFYYIYKVTFYRPQDIYREMRFEQAYSYYWDNNPFMRDLSNEYCATQGQDPDEVLMYLLHEMDKEESSNLSASNSKRFAAFLAKFLLLHVKIKS